MFARRKARTRIRQRDWLKLVGEIIHREQVGTVPPFFCLRKQIRRVENRLYQTHSIFNVVDLASYYFFLCLAYSVGSSIYSYYYYIHTYHDICILWLWIRCPYVQYQAVLSYIHTWLVSGWLNTVAILSLPPFLIPVQKLPFCLVSVVIKNNYRFGWVIEDEQPAL